MTEGGRKDERKVGRKKEEKEGRRKEETGREGDRLR